LGLTSSIYVWIRLRVYDLFEPAANAARFLMIRPKSCPTASANVA